MFLEKQIKYASYLIADVRRLHYSVACWNDYDNVLHCN